MKTQALRSVALTDPGRKRRLNEDALACDDKLGAYIVADGVGGHAKGEVASAEAVDQIMNYLRQERRTIEACRGSATAANTKALRRLIESAVQSACYMVFGMAEMDPDHLGMSTTISALLLAGERGFIAQVGDSRIYRVRGGRGAQLTEDHTLVNYKLKKGMITPAEARTMKGKNVITRAVGHKDHVEVDTVEINVHPGDVFLLCSDGLHGYLNDGELESVLAAGPVDEAPKRFVKLANDRGGKDNITVVVALVEPTGAVDNKATQKNFRRSRPPA